MAMATTRAGSSRVVDDANRGASDLYVLDASSLGRAPPGGGHPPAGAPARPQPRRVGPRRPLPLTGSCERAPDCVAFAAAPRPFMVCMAPALLRDGPRPGTVSRRTDALVASVSQHHRAISAHQSQLLAAVVELDRRRAWRVDGATSMVAWLVQRCGVSAATAREWVTAAAKLRSLPKISDALSQGKLSFDQVKPLVEVAKPETDAQLAEQATHWSAKQVRELAMATRNQSDERSTGFYARRFLRFDDRRRSFTGVLPADQYAVVKSSLVARASRRLRDRTPFDQRMADALVSVCKGDAAGNGATSRDGEAGDGRARAGGLRRNRPTVVVHADMSFLAGGDGGAELDVLGPVSREVARRLACDAKVLVSADDPDGRSLNLGRTRRRSE